MQTIIFDGVNFYNTYKFILTPVNYEASPNISVPVLNASYRPGGFGDEIYTQPRNFELQGIIDADNAEEGQELLDAMTLKLFETRLPRALRLTPEDADPDNIREWDAYMSGPMSKTWRNYIPQISWSMIAPDPRARGIVAEQVIQNLTGAAPDGDVVYGTAVIGGTTPAEPVFTINPINSDISSDITVENETTGEKVVLSDPGTYAPGTLVRVDSARRIVEWSTDNGVNWTSIMNLLTEYTGFPTLKPGVSNDIRFIGFGDGVSIFTIQIDYNNLFV